MATSYQNEIPPARVNIRLSVESGGEAKKLELPLKILLLGKFRTSIDERRVAEREKLQVHRGNMDAVMQSLALELSYTVPNLVDASQDALELQLHFNAINSFEPEQVVSQVPSLRRLLGARNLLRDLGSNLMDRRVFRKELELILKDKVARGRLQEELQERVQFVKEDV
jgi:type VI secretion system protein ImpB